jgi:hypothetical protein
MPGDRAPVCSFVLSLHGEHFAGDTGFAKVRKNLFLLVGAYVGIELNQFLIARHGCLEVVELHTEARKDSVNMGDRVFSVPH